MMIGVLGSLAEHERELIRERTALKRVASRANGTKFGRPRKVDDSEHIVTAKRMKADGHTGKDIAKYLGVTGRLYPGTWTKAARHRASLLRVPGTIVSGSVEQHLSIFRPYERGTLLVLCGTAGQQTAMIMTVRVSALGQRFDHARSV
jgi:hypothetical protein